MADLLGPVRQTVERYRMLAPGDSVVVAVSGGPDSVALAHLLFRLAGEDLPLTLHLAHLDHRLRGREAAEEARFVAGLAEEWGLPCTVEAVDVPAYLARHGGSVEAVARELRYAFLERVAQTVGASRIALGHQADDVAETVLMNLLRGAGPRGLAGIPPVRAGRYVRPLIEVDRAAILAYLEEQGLPYRLDPSNTSPAFFRNRVRHELLPYLEERFTTQVRGILARTADLLRAEDDYLEGVVASLRAALARPDARRRRAGAPGSAGVVFITGILASLHPALLRRLVRQVWAELSGEADEAFSGEGRLSYERVEAVARLVQEGRSGTRVQLPAGVTVRRRYGELVWERRPLARATGLAAVELKVPGEALIPPTGAVVTAEVREAVGAAAVEGFLAATKAGGPFAAAVDADRLEPPLVVRGRRPGDRFWPLGAPGEKKLKEFLIEVKRPAEERDEVLLVADRGGRRLIWVAGERPAEPVRLTPETRRVLLLRVSCAAARERVNSRKNLTEVRPITHIRI